jgi:outer membrane cobalamin receptor
VGYTWRMLTGSISLNNLTDSDYEYVKGYPMPGRHLLLSLQYEF